MFYINLNKFSIFKNIFLNYIFNFNIFFTILL